MPTIPVIPPIRSVNETIVEAATGESPTSMIVHLIGSQGTSPKDDRSEKTCPA